MATLQKLVFMAERILNEKGIKAFNYTFFAWNCGLFSKEIYLDHERLVENDIINNNENITLSKRGKKFLKDIKEIFKDNRDVLEEIDNIVEFSDSDTDSLVNYVHVLTVNVEDHENTVKIGELTKGTDIISKIDERNAVKTFEIDEPWIETGEILMDTAFSKAIKESEIDAREGRAFQLQEVL
jgi:predicted transcriptional regulator